MADTLDLAQTKTSTRDLGELHRRLTAWMANTLGPGSDPCLSGLCNPGKAGMSSETLLFDMTWRQDGVAQRGSFVGRLPPPSDAYPLFPTYDFELQAQVMRLVGERSAVKVPKVIWEESSAEPLGAPFFIMERAEGMQVPDMPPYVFDGWLLQANPEDQARLQHQAVAVIAAVHGVKASDADVEFLKPKCPGETLMRRQLSQLKAYYEWAREDWRVPLVEQLMEWLEENWPESEGKPVVCWGDARPGNILWTDFEPQAVLDWEMATVGPREMDVAWLIFMHKYFQAMALLIGFPAVPMTHFMRRDDVLATYRKLTGYELSDINWYLCFALLRMATLDIRISKRSLHFGERNEDSDPNNYLYCRELIRKVLRSEMDVWG